jgi:hypothetical protein
MSRYRTALTDHTCWPVAASNLTSVPSRDPRYANIPVEAVMGTLWAGVIITAATALQFACEEVGGGHQRQQALRQSAASASRSTSRLRSQP